MSPTCRPETTPAAELPPIDLDVISTPDGPDSNANNNPEQADSSATRVPIHHLTRVSHDTHKRLGQTVFQKRTHDRVELRYTCDILYT